MESISSFAKRHFIICKENEPVCQHLIFFFDDDALHSLRAAFIRSSVHSTYRFTIFFVFPSNDYERVCVLCCTCQLTASGRPSFSIRTHWVNTTCIMPSLVACIRSWSGTGGNVCVPRCAKQIMANRRKRCRKNKSSEMCPRMKCHHAMHSIHCRTHIHQSWHADFVW